MTRLAIADSEKSRTEIAAAILGLGTAAPPALSQRQTLEAAMRLGIRSEAQRAWLGRVYMNCGIESRGTVLADNLAEFYPPAKSSLDRGPTTAVRMSRYAMDAPPLAISAARIALEDAQIASGQITHLITASCTGFFAPGLDAALIEALNLPRDVGRLHVGFMGCHAAFNVMAAAKQIASASDARVLVACVELCSLHMAYGNEAGKIIANALFADGAAAAVVGREDSASGPPILLSDASSLLIPDSREAMTWVIGDHGFEMTLSPRVPEIVRRELGGWCKAWLARNDLAISDIRHWAIHPGGPKILTAVADALGLNDDDLRASRNVLAKHGNMSSATVPFILKELGPLNGPCVAVGLGPGLMAEGLLINGE